MVVDEKDFSYRRIGGSVHLNPRWIQQGPDNILAARIGAHVQRGQLRLRGQLRRNGVGSAGRQFRFEASWYMS